MASTPERHSPDAAERAEKRIAPLELFYDLVFVFALTQVSHLLFNDLSLTGAVHATNPLNGAPHSLQWGALGMWMK